MSMRTSRVRDRGRMRPFYSSADMPVPYDGIVKPDYGAVLSGASINNNCVGCWLFNEGAGMFAYDLSSEAKNGVLSTGDVNPPSWSTNDDGKPCLEFTPSDVHFVDVTGWGLAAPETEMTFMFRQYANANATQSTFQCTNGGGESLNTHCPWSGGTIYWDAGDTTSKRISYTPGSSTIGSWQTWIMTASATGTFSRIYRNGSLEHSGTLTPAFTQGNVPLAIGSGNSGNYFDGKIDFLRVWSRVLSDPEIAQLSAAPYVGIS